MRYGRIIGYLIWNGVLILIISFILSEKWEERLLIKENEEQKALYQKKYIKLIYKQDVS